MVTFPGSKINLGLAILSRQADGYHVLESVFYPLPYTDVLDVVPANPDASAHFARTGIAVDGPPEHDLTQKAYRLLQAEFGLPHIAAHLHKNVPPGAGLGGGSADAVAMLKTLNTLFALHLSEEQLAARAAQLGSDCPFFVHQRPMHLLGTGPELTPFPLSLVGWWCVVLHPGQGVSTAQAFAGAKPGPPAFPLRDTLQMPVPAWRDRLHNAFEDTVFPQRPDLAALKSRLYAEGAMYAAMSGSGAAVFGFFEREPPQTSFHDVLHRHVCQFA